jgi:hypothetical protein
MGSPWSSAVKYASKWRNLMFGSRCTSGVLSLVIFLPTLLSGQKAQENVVPLKNWATPLYWQPNQAEREVAGKAVPQLQLSSNQVSADALTFIAITPCRLVDTRGAGGGFNGMSPFSGPSIPAAGTITIPVLSLAEASANTTPAPCGVISTLAEAYSFNLTVVPAAGGRVNYVSLWPAGAAQPFVATLDDPQGAILSNAAIVPAGTPTGGVSVYNAGPAAVDVIIDMNGYFAPPTGLNFNTAIGAGSLAVNTGSYNTASGFGALGSNTAGGNNTASGAFSLYSNTTGGSNTADGYLALTANTTGTANIATGTYALQSNAIGNNNTAAGFEALQFNSTGNDNSAYGNIALQANTTASDNTATGYAAMTRNTTGSDNTASGVEALLNNTTGSNNTAIGYQAGVNLGTGSNNIYIGSPGVSPSDNGTIRIGSGSQTSFFLAGVSGTTTGFSDAVPVVIDGNGQLGTVNSSRRFKEDIQDMGEASSGLMRLRPVTFRYKQAYEDGSKPVDYGLIAEEVADVYPDLVAHSPSGEIQTVQYQKINAMLLNEVQKQHQQIQEQKEEMSSEISALKARLPELEKQLEALAAPR